MISDASTAREAEALLLQGRALDALALIEPVASRPDASHSERHVYAGVLTAVGRLDDALEVTRRSVEAAPQSPVAEHNLASLLGDLDRWEEAEASCRRALAKGGDAPETWMVLGRSLMHQKRLDEAEAATREAIARRPAYGDAHRDLAQLIWMRTGDRDATTATLEQALAANPASADLAIQLAKAQQYGGRPEAGYRTLADAIARAGETPDYMLEMMASNLAIVTGAAQAALDHATRAVQARPGDLAAGINACDALLGLGQADKAAALALRLYGSAPLEQQVIARLATAWRLTGDPRKDILCDYAQMVRPYVIDTPDGWPNLKAYLADLAAALKRLHAFETHPFDQSLRGGSQTSQDLTRVQEPAVQAFFQAVDGPIRRYMADVGPGEDIMRRRSTGEYAFSGIWSVMLRPDGFHIDHTHPAGWLSSACYIELPEAVEAGGREGWIKFGEPGIPTTPKLAPEHFMQPSPGLLVLFPSYMWHGTVPFSGTKNRLTIAFDLVPRDP
jgi:tetratricopeptide (TPR) repeat protein